MTQDLGIKNMQNESVSSVDYSSIDSVFHVLKDDDVQGY